MEAIKWTDLCSLSMVKCKICKQTLQAPVFEVENFGNVCYSCSQNTTATNTTRNTELEALLSKFWVSCKYAEMGCTFDGSFLKICEHEKACFFKKTICPFTHQLNCQQEAACVDDIIKHICENHKENILDTEDGRIEIPIPVEENPNISYFLLIEDMPYLIVTKFDPNTNNISFAFYYYKENDCSKVSFKFCKKMKSFKFVSDNIYAVAEANIGSTSDIDNVFEIEQAVLECTLRCDETISITVNVEKVNKIDHWKLLDNFKCGYCSACHFKIYECSHCRILSCLDCRTNCSHGRPYYTFYKFCFPQKMIGDLKLSNNNCNNGSIADMHALFNELSTISVYKCSSLITENCAWEGSYDTIMEHFESQHANIVNQKLNSEVTATQKSYIFIEYNCVIIFKYSCHYHRQLRFTVKFIGPTPFSSLLVWELCIRKDNKLLKFTEACEHCIEEKSYDINILHYITDKKISATFEIKPKGIKI